MKLYKNKPEILERSWYNVFKNRNDEVFLVFGKYTDEFCGQVELHNDDEGCNELGIDFLQEQQNKGFGTEAIIAFSNWLYKERNYSKLTIRIDPENKRSQHIFEKLGAVFIEQKSGLSPDLNDLFKKYGINYDEIGPYYYKLSLPIKEVSKEENK